MIAVQSRQDPLVIDLELHPRQTDALFSPANECLFGGAAGGGKSHALRRIAILYALAVPGVQVYLFRRTYPELIDSHVKGPKGFVSMLEPLLRSKLVKMKNQGTIIEFSNGSRIRLCHCSTIKDAWGYASAEIHLLLIDELTQFTDEMYRVLRSRNRCIGLEGGDPVFRATLPRMIGGTNPVGIGAPWVKRAWIDRAPPFAVWRASQKDGGMLRQFIPSLLTDNPNLLQDDPGYLDRLAGLGTPALVDAMLKGLWTGVAGGALSDLFDPSLHMVPSFPIPESWSMCRSMDWGSAKPFSIHWWAEADGREEVPLWGRNLLLPKGTLVAVSEWYGWNGEENKGCRLPAIVVGRKILEREQESTWAGRFNTGPADSQIFAVDDAESIADNFASVGVGWLPCIKGPGSRATGLQKVRQMLRAARPIRELGKIEEPALLFFGSCGHVLRTFSTLPTDKSKPEEVDTEAEDHCYDDVRYMCTFVRDENYAVATSTHAVIGA